MRIFIDCTDTYIYGLNTGIQRVVRSILTYADVVGRDFGLECVLLVFYAGRYHEVAGLNDRSVRRRIFTFRRKLNNCYLRVVVSLANFLPEGKIRNFLVAPRQEPGLARWILLPATLISWIAKPFKRAKQSASPALEFPIQAGDVVFFPDASWSYDGRQALKNFKDCGARLVFFIHDLIPITHPHVFQSSQVARFRQWFDMATSMADGFITNSQYTKKILLTQLANMRERGRVIPVSVVLLGHDFKQDALPPLQHRPLSKALSVNEPKYLCVGTLEPRKNHHTLLDAFEILWANNSPARLILIGRVGWLSDDLVLRIKQHTELGRRLFWFSDVDDASLAAAYHKVNTLIFPSIVEGFGLPLVEALSRHIPVVASDIEVFREIAAGYAHFFPPNDARALVDVLSGLPRGGESFLDAQNFEWPNWEDVTRLMFDEILRLVSREEGGEIT